MARTKKLRKVAGANPPSFHSIQITKPINPTEKIYSAPPIFHLFPALPLELRRKIWTLTAHHQRPIIIDLDSPTYESSGLGCPSPPPAMLHVYSESRIIGLKYYSLTFSTHAKEEGGEQGRVLYPSRVYFNFESDILFLRSGRETILGKKRGVTYRPPDFNKNLCSGFERVQCLGFCMGFHNDWRVSLHWDALRRWPKLKTPYLAVMGSDLNFGTGKVLLWTRLERKEERTFLKTYLGGLGGGTDVPFGWMPVGERLEWVRESCVHGFCYEEGDGGVDLKEERRYEGIKKSTQLVMLVNS